MILTRKPFGATRLSRFGEPRRKVLDKVLSDCGRKDDATVQNHGKTRHVVASRSPGPVKTKGIRMVP